MSTIVLYLLCICLLIHPCLGQEVFSASFEARVRKGRASASCQFELRYSDEGVQEAAVNCTRVTKVGLLNADIGIVDCNILPIPAIIRFHSVDLCGQASHFHMETILLFVYQFIPKL